MGYKHSEFKDFTAEQLAASDYFIQWVLYAERDKETFWDVYLQIYPNQQQTILAAREKVEATILLHQKQPLTSEEKLTMKHAIYQQINQPVKSFTFHRHIGKQLLQAAAIISAVLTVTAYFLNKKSAPAIITPSIVMVQRTGAKETKEIILADSSVVILNANSSITYKSDIGTSQSRNISLEGNAFFKVKKKADQRSFIVHTNSISIGVLGTEFNVNARNKATAIVLTTGKVKITEHNNNSTAIYMSPGEKVQLDTLHHVFVKSATNTLLYSAWTEGKWNFSSTSLLDISKVIHEYYGIETVFANEKIKQLKISAVIPVTDLAAFTTIISKTLSLNITEHNNQLQIKF